MQRKKRNNQTWLLEISKREIFIIKRNTYFTWMLVKKNLRKKRSFPKCIFEKWNTYLKYNVFYSLTDHRRIWYNVSICIIHTIYYLHIYGKYFLFLLFAHWLCNCTYWHVKKMNKTIKNKKMLMLSQTQTGLPTFCFTGCAFFIQAVLVFLHPWKSFWVAPKNQEYYYHQPSCCTTNAHSYHLQRRPVKISIGSQCTHATQVIIHEELIVLHCMLIDHTLRVWN